MISLRQDIFQDDALKIASWLEDAEITSFLNEQENISQSIRSLVNSSRMPVYNQIFNQKGLFYLICLDQKSIGYVKFISKGSHHEIVIAIGEKDLWGQGYGKKALKKALSEAFFAQRYQEITAKIKVMNERSLTLFTHLGFDEEKAHEEMLHLKIDFHTFLKNAA